MTTDEFREHGETVYGYGWQTALARSLDVSSRTVRRWAAGESPIPAGVASNLAAMSAAMTNTARGMAAIEAASAETGGWAAARDGDIVYLAHAGTVVGTGAWDGGLKPRFLNIPSDEIAALEIALREA
jgi:hypothetical protein